MSNAKPFANVPVLSHVLCTGHYCLSVPFFFFFLEGVTMTAKQNNLTLTVIVYLLNTRHILLLSQPSDVCYA